MSVVSFTVADVSKTGRRRQDDCVCHLHQLAHRLLRSPIPSSTQERGNAHGYALLGLPFEGPSKSHFGQTLSAALAPRFAFNGGDGVGEGVGGRHRVFRLMIGPLLLAGPPLFQSAAVAFRIETSPRTSAPSRAYVGAFPPGSL